MRDRFVTIVLSVATTLGIVEVAPSPQKELTVERLIVTKELIVSDTGEPWEKGFEAHQIPRGIYARPVGESAGGLWVRSRLIKGEIDDPFDDRFHAIERNGAFRQAPGHISWNVWLGDAWRQMAIIQGEGLELSEVPLERWDGGTHPGRIRFQTYRPGHGEPLTDAVIGQGKMSIGGGGFGGGGLPYPRETLHLWGGELRAEPIQTPSAPRVIHDDGTREYLYAVLAVSANGSRSVASEPIRANGLATLNWDSVPGADAYIVVRDGKEITEPIRLEGSVKTWTDTSTS
ncbi:MAG TPA: hypothetical protein PLJ47_01390 [Candidatus Hydrogenedentes bacterium]|nr:hypothetical protein [Candidatus Hydrogenedentota bacterium]